MRRGIVLIEVLLAVGILGALLVPILNFFVTSVESSWFASKEIGAQGLVLESFEALRSVRERNWEELAEGAYSLDSGSGIWRLVEDEDGEVKDGFGRLIEILPVYRDSEGAIVDEGEPGVRLDPSTRKIRVGISWRALRERNLTVDTYLTRYLDTLAWIQTTKAEFEQGEFDLAKTIDPPQDDGEVILEGGCAVGSPESLIYDDELQNGWRVGCSGLPFWQWLLCIIFQFFNNGSIELDATDYTWDDSLYSMKVALEPPGSGSFWSWARIYNWDSVCTRGFRNIHFYAYNPGDNEVILNFTAVYSEWDRAEIIVGPKEWTEISLDYEQVQGDWETLEAIYFSKWMSAGDPAIILYVDQIELTGGVGGYFTEGTFTSSVFDAGRETAFNRVSFNADIPGQTTIGFQAASSSSADGPWLFYGPGGTTETGDLYTDPEGEGIWLGNNFERFFRYRAYLRSLDGVSTPTLFDVTVNYSP